MPIGDTETVNELRELVAELKDFVLILDAEDCITQNRAWCEAIGRTEVEVQGRDLLGSVAPSSREHFRKTLAMAKEGRVPGVIEVTFQSRDGHAVEAEGHIRVSSAPNRPAHLHACFHDVTERRRQDMHVRVLSLVADRTDNCVILADAEGLTIWVNEGFTRKTGYTLDDMRGRKPGAVLQGPGSDPAVIQRIREKLNRREGVLEELLNYRRDGTAYVSSIEIRPLFDGQGRLTHFMSVQRDLTQIRAAEAELRGHAAALERRVDERTAELERSRRQFEDLIEFAPDAFVIADGAGTIRFFNRQAELLFGWSRGDVFGRDLGILLPGRHRERHAGLLTDFASRNLERSAPHRPSVTGLRCDGSEFLADISLASLDSPDGKLVAAVIRDNTERRQTEQALLASERVLKEAQQLAQMGSWELELEANRLSWSDEIFRIFEIDQQQFGASYEGFLDRVHPEDRESVDRAYRDSLEKRTEYEVTHGLLMPDGRVKFVQERGTTAYDASGKPLRTLGTVQDVTDGTDALILAAEKRTEINLVITDLHMPQMSGIHLVRTLQRLLPRVPVIVASGRIEPREEQELKSLGVSVQLSKPFTQETLVGALQHALAQRAHILDIG